MCSKDIHSVAVKKSEDDRVFQSGWGNNHLARAMGFAGQNKREKVESSRRVVEF